MDDGKHLDFHPLAHQYVKVPCNAANGKILPFTHESFNTESNASACACIRGSAWLSLICETSKVDGLHTRCQVQLDNRASHAARQTG